MMCKMTNNKNVNKNQNENEEEEKKDAFEENTENNEDLLADIETEDKAATETDQTNDLKEQLLRSLAENENLRKRTIKDIEQIKKFGHISLIRDFLNVVDNLDRAVKSIAQEKETLDTNAKNLLDGVEIVLKEMNTLLNKNQIKRIEPLNEKFDYNYHQAMFEAPSKEHDDGIIIEVIQPGYVLHDRLVRPAMVGVSKRQNEENKQKE
ncbi:MAG: nucleotide exchange factor GrpE [SAR116 cluster bacterium]|mgnify:CR=1 FL=1|nr:nucleotide exchange factor GrpE [SAR116 cluster bacterium]RPH11431.1 MAG: nucleotide exchange factor GrpE [Alphaproteobacteria bacterium TMED54]